jgi:hypothetical protein
MSCTIGSGSEFAVSHPISISSEIRLPGLNAVIRTGDDLCIFLTPHLSFIVDRFGFTILAFLCFTVPFTIIPDFSLILSDN